MDHLLQYNRTHMDYILPENIKQCYCSMSFVGDIYPFNLLFTSYVLDHVKVEANSRMFKEDRIS